MSKQNPTNQDPSQLSRRKFMQTSASGLLMAGVGNHLVSAPVAAGVMPSDSEVSAADGAGESEHSGILERYRRAEALEHEMLVENMVRNANIFANWIGDSDRFWYLRRSKTGREYRMVDAREATNKPAFDHRAFARLLSKASGETVDFTDLKITGVEMSLAPLTVAFDAYGKRWRYDSRKQRIDELQKMPAHWLVSPDGRKAALLRDHNIWIRDIGSGVEKPLTTDGERHYAYGALPDRVNLVAENAGGEGARPEALWSPDSRKLFTVQTDERKVQSLTTMRYVPQDGGIRPRAIERRVALPRDEHIAGYRMVVIDTASAQPVPAQYPNVPDSVLFPGPVSGNRVWWSADSRHAYFVDVTRGQKSARVVSMEVGTGKTRVLFTESADTFIDLGPEFEAPATLLLLPDSGELVWYSQRSGWAHLYLYDLDSGAMKRAITRGNWLVRQLLHYDSKRRELFLQVAGRVAGRDPYYREIVRVHIDSGEMTVVASGEYDCIAHTSHSGAVGLGKVFGFGASHASAAVSPGADYIVTTRSNVDAAPVTELRDRNGKRILQVEKADISGLPEGWKWPERIKMKAADGKTDVYGMVFRPSDFDPEKTWPVLDLGSTAVAYSYAYLGAFVFDPTQSLRYMDAAALAELGFIVVNVGGRGTPYRSKSFHDHAWGRMERGSDLEDHIAVIRQLAQRYPYMDLNRVGITEPGGQNGPVYGLLKYPDFYKVGAVTSVWDPRLLMQGEIYQGPGEDVSYESAILGTLAANLKGKLLMVQGMMDPYYHMGGVFQLVDALIRANKDFDHILLPNGGHSINLQNYGMRKIWDYLVRHLQGVEPPADFRLLSGPEYALERLTD